MRSPELSWLISGLVLALGLAAPADAGASKVYWTNLSSTKIQRADLDGSNVEDLVTPGGLARIALDPSSGKMYWTTLGGGKIQRADLDGSNVEDLVTGLTFPVAIALDLASGKMYWTDAGTLEIQRADLDGSNVEDLVSTGIDPFGIALDLSETPASDLVLDFTGGTDTTAVGVSSAGWKITVSSPLTIDGLGLWDEGADGLTNSHEIGLWTGDCSSLLASVTLSSGTPRASTSSDGQWIFADITPLVLSPGSYLVAATFVTGDADHARKQATASTIPQVTFVENEQAFTATLTCPTTTLAGVDDGFFGPNLRGLPNAARVPALGGWGVLLLSAALVGTAALFGRRRRLTAA